MEPTQQHFAVVIKADGSIPFESDVHPAHKAAMLGHLTMQGHAVKRRDDGSYFIEGWKKPKQPAA